MIFYGIQSYLYLKPIPLILKGEFLKDMEIFFTKKKKTKTIQKINQYNMILEGYFRIT